MNHGKLKAIKQLEYELKSVTIDDRDDEEMITHHVQMAQNIRKKIDLRATMRVELSEAIATLKGMLEVKVDDIKQQGFNAVGTTTGRFKRVGDSLTINLSKGLTVDAKKLHDRYRPDMSGIAKYEDKFSVPQSRCIMPTFSDSDAELFFESEQKAYVFVAPKAGRYRVDSAKGGVVFLNLSDGEHRRLMQGETICEVDSKGIYTHHKHLIQDGRLFSIGYDCNELIADIESIETQDKAHNDAEFERTATPTELALRKKR